MTALAFIVGFAAGLAVGVLAGHIMRRHFGCSSFKFMLW